MSTYTVDELITNLYEENFGHFEFIESMNGGDCDCNLHTTMNTFTSLLKTGE